MEVVFRHPGAKGWETDSLSCERLIFVRFLLPLRSAYGLPPGQQERGDGISFIFYLREDISKEFKRGHF